MYRRIIPLRKLSLSNGSMPWRRVALLGIVLLLCPASLILWGCQQVAKAQDAREDTVSLQVDTLKQAFPLPLPPLSLIDQKERAKFLLTHYWDGCDFDHPEPYIEHPEAIEQAFIDFLAIAQSLPDKIALPELMTPANRANGAFFNLIEAFYRRFLYEEQGPFNNEIYFQAAMEWFLSSPKSGLAIMERDKYLLRMIRLNAVGNVATNFSFVRANGETKRLSDYQGKYALLVFYSPGCDHCKQWSEELSSDAFFPNLVAGGKVNVLYVTTQTDQEAFCASLSDVPAFAIAGVNADGLVESVPLYDLHKSPTVLLLDKDNKVLLRNPTIKEIRAILRGL